MNCPRRLSLAFSLTLVAVVVGGCGGNQNLAEVSGRVTLNGQPLAGAFVKFMPQDGAGAPSFGKTDDQGHYRMMFSDRQAGAWLGENLVAITTADLGTAPGQGKPELLPATYHANSTLKRTVEKRRNVFDFELQASGKPTSSEDYERMRK